MRGSVPLLCLVMNAWYSNWYELQNPRRQLARSAMPARSLGNPVEESAWLEYTEEKIDGMGVSKGILQVLLCHGPLR